LNVWRQSLVEGLKSLTLEGDEFPVRSTPRQKLKQVNSRDLRGLEQTPNTKSRWAQLARKGGKVLQFLEGGRYLAVVADGKVHS
jgi:hypothetical protein